MDERSHGDWQDRIVDAGLQELHGQRPPDLSQRVLLALEEQGSGPLPTLQPRARVALGTWLLAAAMFVLALGIAFYGLTTNGDRAVRSTAVTQLAVEVLAGELECVDQVGGEPVAMMLAAGERRLFSARAGNRLFAPRSTTVRLDVFGTITTGPRTQMEIRSMEYSLKNGAVAASALTLSVVAGVVTWHSLTRSNTATAGESVRLEAAGESASGLSAENARLRQQLLQLQQENDQLRTVREAVPLTPKPVAAVAAETVATPTDTAAVTFDDPRYAEALAKIDWELVGTTTKDMQPLLVELAKMVAEGGEVSTELAVEIQKLNTKLLEQLPAILDADLPGYGPNGAYTHPLVIANSLASTLMASGQPLDAAQQAAIEGLVHAFSVENESVAFSQREFKVEHLLAEMELKERFYDEVGSRLTPEQFAMLYPEGSMDHDGLSLFSTGLMTRPYVDGVPARDAAEFARSTSSRLSQALELDQAATDEVRGIIERLSARASHLWAEPADRTESQLHMPRKGRTAAALKHQIAMLREISRQVKLTPAQRTKLEQLSGVIVPMPR